MILFLQGPIRESLSMQILEIIAYSKKIQPFWCVIFVNIPLI